jgi:hypothetical protein
MAKHNFNHVPFVNANQNSAQIQGLRKQTPFFAGTSSKIKLPILWLWRKKGIKTILQAIHCTPRRLILYPSMSSTLEIYFQVVHHMKICDEKPLK